MVTPEIQLRIDNAKAEKSRQIREFADAKTEQITTTSAFGMAGSWVKAGIEVGAIKWEDRDKVLSEEYEKLREKLVKHLKGGLPF